MSVISVTESGDICALDHSLRWSKSLNRRSRFDTFQRDNLTCGEETKRTPFPSARPHPV